MKISLVTTTINVPVLLKDYVEDLLANSEDEVSVVVTGDKKTPVEARDFCLQLQDQSGIGVDYLSVADQDNFLNKHHQLKKYLPYSCIQRRNVSILKAYEQGAEIIITIDDDNFLAHDNYISGHRRVGQQQQLAIVNSKTGWFNVCKYLKDSQDRKFYHRGFPILQRANETETANDKLEQASGRVVVNAGLWLGDPDIDAITRLAAPINVVNYQRNSNFVLGNGTWSPFNSQNTAIYRDCIPAYFLSPCIGRYDDIWASYIVKKIADHLGDYISYGYPLTKQTRNEHNLWRDLEMEQEGMQLTDVFCQILRAIALRGTGYRDCTVELLSLLKKELEFSELSAQHKDYIGKFIEGYEIWVGVFQ